MVNFSIRGGTVIFLLVLTLFVSAIYSKNLTLYPKIVFALSFVLFLIAPLMTMRRVKVDSIFHMFLILSTVYLAHKLFYYLPTSGVINLRDELFVYFFIPIVFYLVTILKNHDFDKAISRAALFVIIGIFFDAVQHSFTGNSFFPFSVDAGETSIRFSSVLKKAHIGSYIFIFYLIYAVFSSRKHNTYVFFAVFFVIIYSESRMLTIFMSLIYISHIKNIYSIKSIGLILGALAAILLLINSSIFDGRMGVILMPVETMLENQYLRINEFKTALLVISENPLGVSQNYYEINKHMYGDGELNHPHSMFLEILLYNGYVLGGLIVTLYYTMIAHLLYLKMFEKAVLLFFILPFFGPANFGNIGYFILTMLAISGAIILYIDQIKPKKSQKI